MNVIRQEIRTGLLVVFSLAVLVAVVLYLGAPGVFVPQKKFYIFVENAGGLRQGGDVTLAGRKVGQVLQLFSPVPREERPAEAPKAEVMVEVRVNRSAKIYNNVRVQITANGLLGENYIDFSSGDDTSGLAEPKHTFIGLKAPSLGDLAPVLLERLDPLISQATGTLGTLQKTSANIQRMTAPDGELPKTIEQFKQVGANLATETGPEGQLHASLANISKLTGDEGKLSLSLDNIRTLTAPESSLARALRNAEKFTADLNNNRDLTQTLANSRKATEQLNTALTDLRFKFTTVASNLEQATDTVKRQPWRLIWPSTKKYDEPERAASANPAAKKTRSR